MAKLPDVSVLLCELQHLSQVEIAKKYGASPSLVRYRLKEHNPKAIRREALLAQRREIAEQKRRERQEREANIAARDSRVLTEYAATQNRNEVFRRTGISKSTIERILYRHGVPTFYSSGERKPI